jgi:hypothetical protein
MGVMINACILMEGLEGKRLLEGLYLGWWTGSEQNKSLKMWTGFMWFKIGPVAGFLVISVMNRRVP